MRPHLALAILVGVLLQSGAAATTLVRLSDQELARAARVILRGVVLERTSAYRAGPIPVFTDVALEVLEVLKGEVEDPVLHLALPGGQVDGHAYQVAGTPDLRPGLEVVVFLTRLPRGEWVPLGFTQGTRRLVTDPATGALQVRRMDRGVTLVPRAGAAHQGLRAAPSDWSGFRRQVREWARTP
jgi:hypothetical protein